MNVEFELWALPVTQRCHNIFKRNGIQSLADLTKMTKFDLLMLPNLGKKSVQEIVEVLAEMGLSLSVGPEDCYHWLEKGKQINRQLKGLANMKDEFNFRESETEEQSTWMEKTGGYARDKTLRDEFAGLAMQYMGLPTKVYATGRIGDNTWDLGQMQEFPFDAMSKIAYQWADAMLKAREAK